MIWPVYLFYCTIVSFIRIYKWFELQLLKPFKHILKRKGKQLAETLGVILHCPGDPEWTNEDAKRVILNCKYNGLVHIKIHDVMFFPRVVNTGTLGLTETYMEKMWDFCDSEKGLSTLVKRAFTSGLVKMYANRWNTFLEWLELYAFNLQTRKRAFQGVAHYELGNDLFQVMLGTTMQYTCAYYKDANDLDSAQIAKMDLLARKLDLKPGMRVLDVGCGWGTLCQHLAEKYKARCVGVSLAKKGVEFGRELCDGLPVELRVQDYRDLNEKFDRIICVEMLEHVGIHNYPEFFQMVDRCLTRDGIFVLHTMGIQLNNYCTRSEPFFHKYIFPNGHFPTVEDIAKATKKSFVVEDWHNIGPDYGKTIYAWRENFLKGWPQLQGEQYDEKLYRKFVIYLSVAQAGFSSRTAQVWQIVFSKKGLKREYRAAR